MTNTTAKVGRPFAMGNKMCHLATCNITSYTSGGEVIDAGALGFDALDAVMIIGNEKSDTYQTTIEVDAAAGGMASSTTFQIFAVNNDGTNAQVSASADVGMVRVMIMGSR